MIYSRSDLSFNHCQGSQYCFWFSSNFNKALFIAIECQSFRFDIIFNCIIVFFYSFDGYVSLDCLCGCVNFFFPELNIGNDLNFSILKLSFKRQKSSYSLYTWDCERREKKNILEPEDYESFDDNANEINAHDTDDTMMPVY